MQKKLELLTAFGNTDLVLQMLDFFNGPDDLPYNSATKATRRLFAASKITRLVLVCTEAVKDSLEKDLLPRLAAEFSGVEVQTVPLPCKDIACDQDDANMREQVYDTVRDLAAGSLVIASGGRKTLTNRLIEAGLLYGCLGYFSLTAPREKEKRDCHPFFSSLWIPARDFIEERQKGAIKDELGDNFRSLYLLPLTTIDCLRREKTGATPETRTRDSAWLKKLPKADLHCHLGGAFDACLLKELAARLLDELAIGRYRRKKLRLLLEEQLACPLAGLAPAHLLAVAGKDAFHCLAGLAAIFDKVPEPRHLLNAIFVDSLTQAQIEAISWHQPPGLSPEKLLDWYRACGDLGGSSLLQSEGNLRLALDWLMTSAAEENIRLLELRFSPDNYTAAGLTIPAVTECLLEGARLFMERHKGFRINFVIMATRHKEKAAMDSHIDAAIRWSGAGAANAPRVVGFDLAGQEEGYAPERFQDAFMPLHRHFINITIHAGEMAEDDKIWQAIYLLHVRRVGHGLKLVNNKKMMDYVRDHGIAIELCPSSNRQTNGFRLFGAGESTGGVYPLARYLRHGILATINTDNRGISRTDLTREYQTAAALSEGGLSRWDMLKLVKNGFKAAFLPKDEKDRLLKKVDEEVFALMLEEFFPQ